MSDFKGTKAPWNIEEDNNDYCQIYQIGSARIHYGWNNTKEAEEAKADAQLISAAPEMLEALKSVRRLNLHLYEEGTVGNRVYKEVESAISKALN